MSNARPDGWLPANTNTYGETASGGQPGGQPAETSGLWASRGLRRRGVPPVAAARPTPPPLASGATSAGGAGAGDGAGQREQ